jgi:hypothetical protein
MKETFWALRELSKLKCSLPKRRKEIGVSVMTYQETLTQEINSLPPALLMEVLDFVRSLKSKALDAEEHLSEKDRKLQFQQELQALSQAYRARLAKEGKLEQTAEEVMAELKKTREEIAANEYRI